jgi:hypothetical protein
MFDERNAMFDGTQVTCLQKSLYFKNNAMFEVLPDVSYTQQFENKKREQGCLIVRRTQYLAQK